MPNYILSQKSDLVVCHFLVFQFFKMIYKVPSYLPFHFPIFQVRQVHNYSGSFYLSPTSARTNPASRFITSSAKNSYQSFGNLRQLLEFEKTTKKSETSKKCPPGNQKGFPDLFFWEYKPLWSFRTFTNLLLICSTKKEKNAPRDPIWGVKI